MDSKQFLKNPLKPYKVSPIHIYIGNTSIQVAHPSCNKQQFHTFCVFYIDFNHLSSQKINKAKDTEKKFKKIRKYCLASMEKS